MIRWHCMTCSATRQPRGRVIPVVAAAWSRPLLPACVHPTIGRLPVPLPWNPNTMSWCAIMCGQVALDVGIADRALKRAEDRTIGDKSIIPEAAPVGRIVIGGGQGPGGGSKMGFLLQCGWKGNALLRSARWLVPRPRFLFRAGGGGRNRKAAK